MPARINNPGQRISTDELRGVEARLGLDLPDDYRSFLLTHNGGEPMPGWFLHGVDWTDVAEITQFWPAVVMESETMGLRGSGAPSMFVSIGAVSDEEILMLSMSSHDFGAVFWNPDSSDIVPSEFVRIADSFDALLARLDYVEQAKPWMMLIDDDDLDGLRKWLDVGGSAQAGDAIVTGTSALEYAAYRNRQEMVELLMSRGATLRRQWWKFWA